MSHPIPGHDYGDDVKGGEPDGKTFNELAQDRPEPDHHEDDYQLEDKHGNSKE